MFKFPKNKRLAMQELLSHGRLTEVLSLAGQYFGSKVPDIVGVFLPDGEFPALADVEEAIDIAYKLSI